MKNKLKNLRLKISFIIILSLFILVSCEHYTPDVDILNQTKKIETSKQNVIETKENEETKKIIETEETAHDIKNIKIDVMDTDTITNYKTIKFGSYEQDNDVSNGKEEIEWIIMDKTDNSYLLLSKNILDCKNFNVENNFVTFSNSTLCGWLNNDFYNAAFDNDMKKYIVNDEGFSNLKYNKVSLLDLETCLKNFGDKQPTNEKLQSFGTEYAINNGLEVDNNKNKTTYKMGSYFLSDNGETKDKAVWVGIYGHIYVEGQPVKLNIGDGVRPIIAVSKDLFTKNLINLIDMNLANVKSEFNNDLLVEDNLNGIDENDETYENEEDETENEISNDEANLNEETSEIVKEKVSYYSNYIKQKYTSPNCPITESGDIDLTGWEYGSTPLEWIYVVPNTQIIANNNPNTSKNFSYRRSASSGNKGCYIPVFNNSISKGIDYEGRFYSIEDYVKYTPEEMKFKNSFSDLKYGDYNVRELLEKKYNVETVSGGIIKIGDVYVNVIYAEELDEIINNY